MTDTQDAPQGRQNRAQHAPDDAVRQPDPMDAPTDPSPPWTPAPGIPHSRGCTRPKPIRRASWKGTPEDWCPSCGRAAAA